MPEPLSLDPKRTALVLIDLQQGILQRDTQPHSATDVLARSVQLANAFRAAHAPVVLVRVSYSPTGADIVRQPTDAAFAGGREPGWDVLSPDLATGEHDIHVTKRNWGAFYGTDLDLQLRRRGVETIVLGGIATNFGVESTARDAFERNYAIVFAEDAMAGTTAGAHEFACTTIFPRIGRVRSTRDVLGALGAA
jgi:nicotinamidase-related amidase